MDIAGVSKEELYENIISITAKRKSNAILFVKELVVDEEFAEWFGLFKGDGCIRKTLYDVAFSNEDPELHQFFMRMVRERFGFPKRLFYVSLRTPDSVQVDVHQLRVSWSRELGLPLNRIKGYTKPSLGIVADLFVSSAALAWLLTALRNELRKNIERSPIKIKKAYLRGYFAAEGHVNPRKTICVTLDGKDFEELSFVSHVLNDIGINHRLRRYGVYSRIVIHGWQNIRKFHVEIGFGKNKKREDVLKHAIESYKEFHLPQNVRLAQICDEIAKQKNATISRLMKKFNLSEERVRQLLYILVNRQILRVNKRKRPHIFQWTDVIDNTPYRC